MDIVVDIGNTRVKWGSCVDGRLERVSPLRADEADWDCAAAEWGLRSGDPSVRWFIAGVVPAIVQRLSNWARRHWAGVRVLTAADLPLHVHVPEPEKAGIDRLLGAVAVEALSPGRRTLVVDCGSAVTINLVDEGFRGGAILPGLRLLGAALHDQTALLPLVDVPGPVEYPGRDTRSAIQAGLCAVVGGAVERIANEVGPAGIIFTGGDGDLVRQLVRGLWEKRYEPWLNLNGIIHTVRSLDGRGPPD